MEFPATHELQSRLSVVHDVLYLIAMNIDDPQTFYNFALVSKKSARVCRMVIDQIINHFVREKIRYHQRHELPGGQGAMIQGDPKHIWHELPNGKKHGIEEKLSHFRLQRYKTDRIITGDF